MKKYIKGFTLVELLFVIFLFSFVFMKNLSWIHYFVSDWKLSNVSKSLMGTISLSRHFAVDRGVGVTLCGLEGDRACTNDGDWGSGWLVYLDTNKNGLIEDDEEVVRLFHSEDDVNIAWNNGSHIVFNPLGEANVSGSFSLCLKGGGKQFGDRLILNLSGRVRVEDYKLCSL